MNTIFPYSNAAIRLTVMKNFMQFMEEAILQGYVIPFTHNKLGYIQHGAYSYASDEIIVDWIYCFDGEHDGDDYANLYLLETRDGLKGTLVQVYSRTPDGEEIIYSNLDDLDLLP